MVEDQDKVAQFGVSTRVLGWTPKRCHPGYDENSSMSNKTSLQSRFLAPFLKAVSVYLLEIESKREDGGFHACVRLCNLSGEGAFKV